MRSVNPATGKLIREYEEMSASHVGGLLERAAAAAGPWGAKSFAQRAEPLREAARLLRAGADDLALTMAAEMGKPVDQGKAEAEKCAWVCEHYAKHAERMLADEPADIDAKRSYVAFRPLGVVLGVMPWNFPFWQVFRFAAPTLMAGNAVVLKHASNVTGCALAIEELLRRAWIPESVFRTAVVGSGAVAEMIERDEIAAVTLTGSTGAGRAVAAAAGRALKKTVLELGGSDPYVVLGDADLEQAVATCVRSRLLNSGQSCIAAKRFVVVDEVADEFTERIVAAMRGKRSGDPLEDGDVDLGPLARVDLRDALHAQVKKSVELGAERLLGGEVPDGSGAFYPPTVLGGVRPGMPAYSEETFGPVAAIIRARDEEEGVAIANDTSFGLGAAVFTRDVERGERIARERLDAGCCFVNGLVRSDPRLAFGGIKGSGYGRELGPFGIREFVNTKTVVVA
jgi:succinate-semialdehyde dehydrogenase/glutarate-semialdehyde dehydrogenase